MNSGQGRGRGRGRGKVPQEPSLPGSGPGPQKELSSHTERQTSRGRGRAQTRSDVAAEAQSVASALFELPKSSLKIAKRPGYGNAGRPIELITNYFQLKLSGVIYHYDVEITSIDQRKKYGKTSRQLTAAEAAEAGVPRLKHELDRGVGKLRRKEVFDAFIRSHKLEDFHPVFDGVKNIFTSRPLPFKEKVTFTIDLEVERRTRPYEVALQPVKKESGTNKIFLEALQDSNETEVIMALNSVMNYRDAKSTQIQVGRSFFYLNQTNKVTLGEGLEIWFGYHQSVHSTEKGAAIVINLAAKAFHKEGPVLDYIKDILRRDITRDTHPMKPYEVKNVSDSLKGVKVEVTHLPYPRRFIVEGISKRPADEMKLNVDGKDLSIAKYFELKYGRLRYPFLPCLFMRTSNKQTYIPLEHCRIMRGQPKLGKLTPSLGAKMIKQTAINPDQRFRSIEKSSKDVSRESGERMRSYNLLLNLRNIQVSGRVLNFPALAYYDQQYATPDMRGVWNITNQKLFKSLMKENDNSWIILDFAECNQQTIDKFIHFFKAAGKKVGLNFGSLCDVRRCGGRVSAEKALQDAERTKAAFAIIILSRRDRYHSYDEIKFIADYKLRFINQCIDSNVLDRFNDQIATNLCLKINAKLGGVNHVLRNKHVVFSRPVMIVGADAVHSPRGAKCPSIAAVVGSMDAYPSKYRISCRVQENPDEKKISQELILEMRAMMADLLKAFYSNTGGKHPEKIIFFRDGVSEGQFTKTFEYEVSEIQKACQDIFQFIIPITFVVVQKRHQTRFKPLHSREGVGRNGNIPPGTAIDRDIVHPHRFDYFLNSHEGIQGTNKPAHYTVLHDDNKFTADELQELSYHLCYTYNKCNRSISIPAPVKYADLACYRAKKFADFHLQKEQESSSSSSNSSVRLSDYAKEAINTMGEIGRNFFFV